MADIIANGLHDSYIYELINQNYLTEQIKGKCNHAFIECCYLLNEGNNPFIEFRKHHAEFYKNFAMFFEQCIEFYKKIAEFYKQHTEFYKTVVDFYKQCVGFY